MNPRLAEILNTMDVPLFRVTDLRWLGRNLAINNGDHPAFEEAMRLLVEELAKPDYIDDRLYDEHTIFYGMFEALPYVQSITLERQDIIVNFADGTSTSINMLPATSLVLPYLQCIHDLM